MVPLEQIEHTAGLTLQQLYDINATWRNPALRSTAFPELRMNDERWGDITGVK